MGWQLQITVYLFLFLTFIVDRVKMIIKQNEKVDQSFWWLPWTRGVNGSPHCGVGVFGKEGTEVRPSVGGVVLYSGWFNDVAGNMIVVLGPKWKLHEYMHLKESFVKWGRIVGHDTVIGLLGKTGNAAKTPAHLHYTILTPVPHFWLYDKVYGNGRQPEKFNWQKMFYRQS